jgi:hypothetical protein
MTSFILLDVNLFQFNIGLFQDKPLRNSTLTDKREHITSKEVPSHVV